MLERIVEDASGFLKSLRLAKGHRGGGSKRMFFELHCLKQVDSQSYMNVPKIPYIFISVLKVRLERNNLT